MNIEWLNKNRYRSYPFVEDSDFTIGMVSTDDGLIFKNYGTGIQDFETLPFIETSGVPTFYTFPKYSFVDLVVIDSHLSANTELDQVRLLGLEKSEYATVLYLSYQNYFSKGIRSELRTDTFTVDEKYIYERQSGYMKAKLVSSCYTVTKTKYITSSDLDIPVGTYRFKNPPVLIDSRVLRVGFCGVTGIGTARPDTYGTNTIYLGYGCNSELHTNDNNKVVLYVGTTWGECNCEHDIDDDTKCSSYMMFFNGQTADASGNIGIIGGPGITINPSGELIQVNSENGSYGVPSITISASSSLKAAIGLDT